MTRSIFGFIRLFVVIAALVVGGVTPTHASENPPSELAQPIRVTLRLEGRHTPLRGEITAWTFGAFRVLGDGGAHPIDCSWNRIDADKVFQIMRRILGREDARGYLRLGIEMLRLDEPRLAGRALTFASRLDKKYEQLSARAIEIWEDGGDPGAVILEEAENEVRPAAPEAQNRQEPDSRGKRSGPSPVDDAEAAAGAVRWQPLEDEARLRAIEMQRRFVLTAGHEVGDNKRRIYETDHFIMATDLDERSMRRWGERLEEMYATMIEMFGLQPDSDLYAGKCMVFVFGSRDAFIKFERIAMNYDASRSGGVCHYRGHDVILAFYRKGSEAEFQSVLIHESTHGFLYRYHSPSRLPTWANEGLADYIAGHLTPASHEPREHWNHAKSFILRNQDPSEIMSQSYRDGTWFTEDSYPVSHMLVRFLLKYKPAEFRAWIDDIKAGAEWRQAMTDHFGVDAETIARGFADDIRSERHFTPIN